MALDAGGAGCSATDGFECHRAGSGKQIDYLRPDDTLPKQIKDGLSHAVLHGSSANVAAVFELSTTQQAADNAQADNGLLNTAVCTSPRHSFLGHPPSVGLLFVARTVDSDSLV